MMIRTIIRSDSVAYPWFAPAGLRRGVVDNATQIGYIVETTGEFQTLGVNQGLRDVLYQNNVNPITFIPGTGITNFGNHTLQGNATALDRINVARLVAYLRGQLEIIGNQYLFEPNDTITRQSITNQITALMINLVNKRGIYDYLVVCDLSNNTPATIDANELYVDIAIEPVKAVEFIYIPMRIQNTGTIAAQESA
jgi:phage tail sheath protein FI